MSSSHRIRIGEVAKRIGITIHTLRHYEALGLKPPARRNEGRQRLYGASEIARLQQIVMLKQLGLGLAEISTLLNRP